MQTMERSKDSVIAINLIIQQDRSFWLIYLWMWSQTTSQSFLLSGALQYITKTLRHTELRQEPTGSFSVDITRQSIMLTCIHPKD